MAFSDVRQTYGFRSEITDGLSSYLIGGHPVDNFTQGPSVSPTGFIGFTNVDVRSNEGFSPMSPFYNQSHLNMSSALESMSNQITGHQTPSLELYADEKGLTVFDLCDLDEGECEAAEEEEPTEMFQSKFFDSFPLYQDYRLPTVRKEIHKLKDVFASEIIIPERFNNLTGIRRFERCESEPSKLQNLQSPLSPMENLEFHSLPDQTPPPPSQSLTASPSSASPQSLKVSPYTYWQDLPEVKMSGLLHSLTHKEISLQEATFELIGSEASYLKSLGVLVDHFSTSKALKRTVSKMEHKVLFSNSSHVMGASARFLKDLETRLDENPYISQVGDLVLKHSRDFRRHYVPYVTNMAYQESLVNRLLEQNQDFAYEVKKLESDPACHRQSLKSFLVLPFQRITRMKLLLETILKPTKPDTDSASNLEKAINAIHEIVTTCDNNVSKMKKIEELIYLEMMMDFRDVKLVPLVVSTRHLVHQGSMKMRREKAHGSRMSFINIYLHLFNDLLIISSKRNQKFMVADHALFPAHVTVEHLKTKDMGLPQESFLLRLSWSQKGHRTAMTLVANTQLDKEEWMKALSSK